MKRRIMLLVMVVAVVTALSASQAVAQLPESGVVDVGQGAAKDAQGAAEGGAQGGVLELVGGILGILGVLGI